MSEKFPEDIFLSNGLNGVHITDPFPSGGLYSACMNAKSKKQITDYNAIDKPPGFEIDEPRRKVSDYQNMDGSPSPISVNSLDFPQPHKRFFLNFEPLSNISQSNYSSTINFGEESKYVHHSAQVLPLPTPCIKMPTSDTFVAKNYQKKINHTASAKEVQGKKSYSQKGNKFGGNLIERIKDPRSSQYLQKSILVAEPSTISDVIYKIEIDLPNLIQHKYGNYFIKALISNTRSEQRLIILKAIQSVFLQACFNMYGIHPLQALLSMKLSLEEEVIVRNNLKGNIIKMSLDEHGSYVAQKVMRLVKDSNDDIFTEIYPHFVYLSKTEKGLNVVKKLIIELIDSTSQKMLVSKVLENSEDFIDDYYCNYAIQLMVQLWPISITQELFMLIVGKIKQYSLQKSSSNVVETMICCSPPHIKSAYFNEIASLSDIHVLLQSGFGNYVVQKALEISLPDEKAKLICSCEAALEKIKDLKIRNKWKKIIASSMHM